MLAKVNTALKEIKNKGKDTGTGTNIDADPSAESYHEYIPDRAAVAALKALLAEWNLKAPCVSRFTQPLGKNYNVSGVLVHAIYMYIHLSHYPYLYLYPSLSVSL